MEKRDLLVAKVLMSVLLVLFMLWGLPACSHGSSGDFGDNSETRYFGISGGDTPEPEIPVSIPVAAPAPVPAPAPAPAPVKRYKPLIHIYWENSSDRTNYSYLAYGPGKAYTTSSGGRSTYPITLNQGKTSEPTSFNVIIWAEDEDLASNNPNKYTNVTSDCSFNCQWTLTPNPTYTPAQPLSNGNADYVVMTGPADTATCNVKITLPPALPKGSDTIHTWSDSARQWYDKQVDDYPYSFDLAVDVELVSSTVLFNEPLPKQKSWTSSVTYHFRYDPGVEPYASSGSGGGGSGSGGGGSGGNP